MHFLLGGNTYFNGGDNLVQLIGVMVVLLLIAGGIAAFFIYRGNDKERLKRMEEKLDKVIAEIDHIKKREG